MSNNYYWANRPRPVKWTNPLGVSVTVDVPLDESNPAVHICQVVNATVVWAQDPDKILDFCMSHKRDDLIVDDCGVRYTCDAFAGMAINTTWDRSMIGKAFS